MKGHRRIGLKGYPKFTRCREDFRGRSADTVFRGSGKMTLTELSGFQAMLKTKHVELTRLMGKRDGIAIERTADALDQVQLAAQRELITRGLDRESKVLRNVRAALARIADGSYGACFQCEEEIGTKRLNAIPWATLCISCQEQADRNPEPGSTGHERLLLREAA
jgi:DnaK suppressor protein